MASKTVQLGRTSYAQVLTAVQRGQQARRDSWPAVLTIGVKSGQLWQFGGPAAAQAYIPTSDDKNATDWVIIGEHASEVVDVEAVKLSPTAPQVPAGESLGKEPNSDVYDSRGVPKEGGKSAPVGGRGPTAPRDAKPAPTDSARRAAQPINTVTDRVDSAGNEKAGAHQIGIRGTHTSRDTYKVQGSAPGPVVQGAQPINTVTDRVDSAGNEKAGAHQIGIRGTHTSRDTYKVQGSAPGPVVQGVAPVIPSPAVDPAQQKLVDAKHDANADLAERLADANQVGNEHRQTDTNAVEVRDLPHGGATDSGAGGSIDTAKSARGTAGKSDKKWSGETKPASSK